MGTSIDTWLAAPERLVTRLGRKIKSKKGKVAYWSTAWTAYLAEQMLRQGVQFYRDAQVRITPEKEVGIGTRDYKLFDNEVNKLTALTLLSLYSAEELYKTHPNLFAKGAVILPGRGKPYWKKGKKFFIVDATPRTLDPVPVEATTLFHSVPVTFVIDPVVQYEREPISFYLAQIGNLLEKNPHWESDLEGTIREFSRALFTSHYRKLEFPHSFRTKIDTQKIAKQNERFLREEGVKISRIGVQKIRPAKDQDQRVFTILAEMERSSIANEQALSYYKTVVSDLVCLVREKRIEHQFLDILREFHPIREALNNAAPANVVPMYTQTHEREETG